MFSGFKFEMLNLVSIIAIFFGICVLIIKNPIESLMALIGLFASISIYLILIGLTFIGFSYLIVYIGAVSILFIFILMLIDIRTSELQSYNWNIIPLGVFVTVILQYTLSLLLPYYITIMPDSNYIYNNIEINKLLFTENFIFEDLSKIMDNLAVMYTTSSSWDSNLIEINHVSTIGNIIYTTHNIWLFLASFILLLVMVGAIIITITQSTKD